MNDVYNKIRDINIKPGKDYNLIYLSMEPKETIEVAHGKKANYLKSLVMKLVKAIITSKLHLKNQFQK